MILDRYELSNVLLYFYHPSLECTRPRPSPRIATAVMKIPCRDCPLKIQNGVSLAIKERLKITKALFKDRDFKCQHTYDCNEQTKNVPYKSRRCTGAAIFLENAKKGGVLSNFAFQLAIMAGEFKISQLDMEAPVFRTRKDFETITQDWN